MAVQPCGENGSSIFCDSDGEVRGVHSKAIVPTLTAECPPAARCGPAHPDAGALGVLRCTAEQPALGWAWSRVCGRARRGTRRAAAGAPARADRSHFRVMLRSIAHQTMPSQAACPRTHVSSIETLWCRWRMAPRPGRHGRTRASSGGRPGRTAESACSLHSLAARGAWSHCPLRSETCARRLLARSLQHSRRSV